MSPSLPPALVDFMHQHQYRPEPLKSSGNGFLRFPVGKESNGGTSGYVKLFPDFSGRSVFSSRAVQMNCSPDLKSPKTALSRARQQRSFVLLRATPRVAAYMRQPAMQWPWLSTPAILCMWHRRSINGTGSAPSFFVPTMTSGPRAIQG